MQHPLHFWGVKHSTLETPGIENSGRKSRQCQITLKEYGGETNKPFSVWGPVLDVLPFSVLLTLQQSVTSAEGRGER